MSNRRTVVLVVEDDPIIRMGALQLVVAAGFEALEACGADEAIRILEDRGDIRLVFTDVGMPGTMDGIKLSHYIRDRWPPVKLIVASGKAILDESHLPLGTKLFHKPYHDNSIIEAMISMLPEANGWHPETKRNAIGKNHDNSQSPDGGDSESNESLPDRFTAFKARVMGVDGAA